MTTFGYPIAVLGGILTYSVHLKKFMWLLMIHMSYYSVAHRIDALAALLSSVDGCSTIQQNVYHVFNRHRMDENKISVLSVDHSKTQSMVNQKLRTCGYLFDHLSQTSMALNSVFSLPILLILTSTLITSTLFLYFIIYEYFQPTIFNSLIHGRSVDFGTNLIFLAVLLTAPDMPVIKVFFKKIYR